MAYKRLEKAEDLDRIPKMRRLARFFTFCQLPALVRSRGWTVGATLTDNMNERCARIHGLAVATEESKVAEAAQLATTWFVTVEEAAKQQNDYPRIPAGEALVLAPLASGKFDPDVVLTYRTPAQLMLVLNGLQRRDYERFQFFFIGEGACADSLAQCYVAGKPSLAIPCFGERRFGEVRDEELVLALTPAQVEKAIHGDAGALLAGTEISHSLLQRGMRPPPGLGPGLPPDGRAPPGRPRIETHQVRVVLGESLLALFWLFDDFKSVKEPQSGRKHQ